MGRAWTPESYAPRIAAMKAGWAKRRQRIRANVRINPLDAYRPGVSLDRRMNDECSGAVLVYVFVAIMAFVMGLVVRSYI